MAKKFRRYLYSFWRNSRMWQTDRLTPHAGNSRAMHSSIAHRTAKTESVSDRKQNDTIFVKDLLDCVFKWSWRRATLRKCTGWVTGRGQYQTLTSSSRMRVIYHNWPLLVAFNNCDKKITLWLTSATPDKFRELAFHMISSAREGQNF